MLYVLGLVDSTKSFIDRYPHMNLMLPMTAPSRHQKNPILITQIIELMIFSKKPFQTNTIQVHMLHIFHLSFNGFVCIHQQHIICPSSPFDQDSFSEIGRASCREAMCSM